MQPKKGLDGVCQSLWSRCGWGFWVVGGRPSGLDDRLVLGAVKIVPPVGGCILTAPARRRNRLAMEGRPHCECCQISALGPRRGSLIHASIGTWGALGGRM